MCIRDRFYKHSFLIHQQFAQEIPIRLFRQTKVELMAEQEQLCHRLLRHRSKIRDNELPENSSLIFPPFHLRNKQVEQRFWLSETKPNYKPDCHPERQVCPTHHCQNYLSQHCRDFLWWAAKLPCYQLHQVRS